MHEQTENSFMLNNIYNEETNSINNLFNDEFNLDFLNDITFQTSPINTSKDLHETIALLENETHNLRQKLIKFSESAVAVKTVYEQQKSKINQLTQNKFELEKSLEIAQNNIEIISDELANQKFIIEQYKGKLDIKHKIEDDKSVDNLKLKYIIQAIKLHKNGLLDKYEKREISEIRRELKSKKVNVPNWISHSKTKKDLKIQIDKECKSPECDINVCREKKKNTVKLTQSTQCNIGIIESDDDENKICDQKLSLMEDFFQDFNYRPLSPIASIINSPLKKSVTNNKNNIATCTELQDIKREINYVPNNNHINQEFILNDYFENGNVINIINNLLHKLTESQIITFNEKIAELKEKIIKKEKYQKFYEFDSELDSCMVSPFSEGSNISEYFDIHDTMNILTDVNNSNMEDVSLESDHEISTTAVDEIIKNFPGIANSKKDDTAKMEANCSTIIARSKNRNIIEDNISEFDSQDNNLNKEIIINSPNMKNINYDNDGTELKSKIVEESVEDKEFDDSNRYKFYDNCKNSVKKNLDKETTKNIEINNLSEGIVNKTEMCDKLNDCPKVFKKSTDKHINSLNRIENEEVFEDITKKLELEKIIESKIEDMKQSTEYFSIEDDKYEEHISIEDDTDKKHIPIEDDTYKEINDNIITDNLKEAQLSNQLNSIGITSNLSIENVKIEKEENCLKNLNTESVLNTKSIDVNEISTEKPLDKIDVEDNNFKFKQIEKFEINSKIREININSIENTNSIIEKVENPTITDTKCEEIFKVPEIRKKKLKTKKSSKTIMTKFTVDNYTYFKKFSIDELLNDEGKFNNFFQNARNEYDLDMIPNIFENDNIEKSNLLGVNLNEIQMNNQYSKISNINTLDINDFNIYHLPKDLSMTEESNISFSDISDASISPNDSNISGKSNFEHLPNDLNISENSLPNIAETETPRSPPIYEQFSTKEPVIIPCDYIPLKVKQKISRENQLRKKLKHSFVELFGEDNNSTILPPKIEEFSSKKNLVIPSDCCSENGNEKACNNMEIKKKRFKYSFMELFGENENCEVSKETSASNNLPCSDVVLRESESFSKNSNVSVIEPSNDSNVLPKLINDEANDMNKLTTIEPFQSYIHKTIDTNSEIHSLNSENLKSNTEHNKGHLRSTHTSSWTAPIESPPTEISLKLDHLKSIHALNNISLDCDTDYNLLKYENDEEENIENINFNDNVKLKSSPNCIKSNNDKLKLSKESIFISENPLILKNSDNNFVEKCVDINYSPGSPFNNNEINYDENLFNKPIIIPVKYENNDEKTNVNSLIDYYISYYTDLRKDKSFQPTNFKTETIDDSKIITKLRSIFEHYVEGDANLIQVKKCTIRCFNRTKNINLICKAIIEIIEDTNDKNIEILTPPLPSMSLTHQKIIILINEFNNHYENLYEIICNLVEQRIFNFNDDKIELNILINLTIFYIGLIDLQESSKNTARLFICKCFYYYKKKSLPLIYHILTAYPQILPNENDEFYDKNDPLINTIKCILNSQSYNMEKKDLKHPQIFHMLKLYYNYERVKPSREELIDNFIDNLRNGKLFNISYSFSIICKHQGIDWTENYVIKKKLLPLINEGFNLININDKYDNNITIIIETLSFILKPFPLNYNIEYYINIFCNFLNLTNRKMIQEAAIKAILRTSRFGVVNCFNIIAKWKPDYKIDDSVEKMLLSFLYKKPPKYWRKLEKNII